MRHARERNRRRAAGARFVTTALVACAAALAGGADGPAPGARRAGGEDAAALAGREAELLARYRDLERSLLRLADLLAASDPRRAAVLRAAFDRARDGQVGERMEKIVALLEEGQLLKAGTSQRQSIEQFQALLDLLEAGTGERKLTDTKREVREFLGRVSKLISRQRDIEGATESGGDTDELAGRQRAAADETRDLGEELGGLARRLDDRDAQDRAAGQRPDDEAAPPKDDDAGGPGESSPPSAGGDEPATGERSANEQQPIEGDDDASRAKRTRQRLQAAEGRMRRARERLEETRSREARQEQEKAVEELETARAELEEILRQVREEEVERLLVQLETRIRGMLRAELAIRDGLEKLVASATVQTDRERQLEATRLGREQTTVAADAGRTLSLVRDDGSAVAIPQALEQVRDDALQVAARLEKADAGAATAGLVGDVIAGLEEILAAVEKARQDARADAERGGAAAGEPGEQPLVDSLAELKMLRVLQVRVNARTKRLAQLIDDGVEQAAEPELRAALERLGTRQRAIEQAARDIVAGLPE